jgi:hypothetical protein
MNSRDPQPPRIGGQYSSYPVSSLAHAQIQIYSSGLADILLASASISRRTSVSSVVGRFFVQRDLQIWKDTAAHKEVHVFIGWTGKSHLGGGSDCLHDFVEIRIRIFYRHIKFTAIAPVPTAVMVVAFKGTEVSAAQLVRIET